MDKNKLCNDMVNMFREQRHDFSNHFQVVLGYLQLNKTDRAVTYIKQVTQEMQGLSSVIKLETTYLVLVLLLALQKSKNLGIRLFFHIEKGASFCRDYSEYITDQLAGMIDQVLQCLSTGGKEDQWMEITLKETDQSFIWVIACSPFLPYEELVHQLQSQLDQGLGAKGSLQADKLPEEIRLIFHILKNN